MFSNFSIRQWTRNCFPSSLYTLQAKAWNRKIQNGQHKTPSQFMLQPSRNKWRALRQQEVSQITAPKTQFAMETTTLSIQNYVRCSRHTLPRLPLSRPALPVKGQGGGGRSSPPAAILSTSANFALTTTSLHWDWWLSNARAKNKLFRSVTSVGMAQKSVTWSAESEPDQFSLSVTPLTVECGNDSWNIRQWSYSEPSYTIG